MIRQGGADFGRQYAGVWGGMGGGVRFWKFLSIVFYLDRWLRLQREWTAVVAREMNGDDGR